MKQEFFSYDKNERRAKTAQDNQVSPAKSHVAAR